MRKKLNILNVIRILVEAAALVLVILLVKNNKLQMWLIIFAAGVAVSFLGGRFFCGWICPMNTVFRVISIFYKKMGIKRFKAPGFLKNDVVRFLFLTIFFAAMVIIKATGIHLNMLLYIILFSIVFTLLFEEEVWHRHICPFGTILSITSKKAKVELQIDEEICISCGKCQTTCPSQSIVTLPSKKRSNRPNECLLCGQCIDVCPVSVCRIKIKNR